MTRPDLSLCTYCGRCLQLCPSYLRSRQEIHSPRARIALIQTGKTRHPSLKECLLCGNCQSICPNKVPLPERIFQERIRERGPLPFPLSLMGISPPKSLKDLPSGDIYIFLSCGAQRFYPEAVEKLSAFLRAKGFSPVLTPVFCCGLPVALWEGQKKFRRQAQRVLEELLSLPGPLLTLCASCLWTFKHLYPLVLGEEARPLQNKVQEALTFLLREDLSPVLSVKANLLWHLPCHLRAEVQGLKIPWPVLDTCCGAPNPTQMLFSPFLPSAFLEKLYLASPALLATGCSGCYLKIRRFLKSPPEVRHWAELLSV